MNLRLKICLPLALIAATGVSHSESIRDSESDTTASSVDIVGVKLGMTPDEVRQVLRKRKFPTHEFTSTLSYVDSASRKPVQLPNSIFLNAIVQSAPFTGREQADNLTVFFSPTPGNERVVAVSRYNGYPNGVDIHEAALRQALSDKYGTIPDGSAVSQNNFQYSHVWSVPTHDKGLGKECRFNLTEHFAQAGWWDSNGAGPQNYVINNRDLIFSLIKKNCGPSVIEINWSDRDSHAPPEQRLLSQNTAAILSVSLADESLMTASKMVEDYQQRGNPATVRRAADSGRPEL